MKDDKFDTALFGYRGKMKNVWKDSIDNYPYILYVIDCHFSLSEMLTYYWYIHFLVKKML